MLIRHAVNEKDKLKTRRAALEKLFSPENSTSNGGTEGGLHMRLRQRYPGTCQWIYDNSEFQEWVRPNQRSGEHHQGTINLLWIHAIPGAGKSTMAAYVINHLLNQVMCGTRNDTTLFFFCQHDAEKQSTAYEVVKALLLQVYQKNCLAYPVERMDREFFRKMDDITQEDLYGLSPGANDDRLRHKFTVLSEEIGMKGTTRVIVDGLDELEDSEAERTIQFLSYFCGANSPTIKLLIFSRKVASLEDKFESVSHSK
jgi:hypothetical protein